MHTDAITHAAQHESACGRAAQSQSRLYSAMVQHVIDQIAQGQDERLPNVRDPQMPGMLISEWITAASTEKALFKLLHVCLNKASAEHMHEEALKVARLVGEEFGEYLVAGVA
jgi:hypothetical protein